MHQTCCVFEARLEIVLPVSQDADVFVRRCHPPWFSRCGPGALCDWQQDSPHLESQGSGSWPSWGPVLPHQEGSQHPQAPGEEQEGVNSFHCLLSLNSSYCIIPFIFSFFLMFSQNTLFFFHYSYSLFFLLKWDDCIWKYHKMPGTKCAHMHSLCCLLPSSNSWFVCLCTTNAVLSGVHQSHAGSVLANPSPGFMLGIRTFVHCIWVDIFLTWPPFLLRLSTTDSHSPHCEATIPKEELKMKCIVKMGGSRL